MIYLYYMNAARRLQRVMDKQGNHVCAETKDKANEQACYWSLYADYPVTLDRNPDLHDTVDGKSNSMLPTYRYVEPHAYEVSPPVVPTPWYRHYTKLIGKRIRSFWAWC